MTPSLIPLFLDHFVPQIKNKSKEIVSCFVAGHGGGESKISSSGKNTSEKRPHFFFIFLFLKGGIIQQRCVCWEGQVLKSATGWKLQIRKTYLEAILGRYHAGVWWTISLPVFPLSSEQTAIF